MAHFALTLLLVSAFTTTMMPRCMLLLSLQNLGQTQTNASSDIPAANLVNRKGNSWMHTSAKICSEPNPPQGAGKVIRGRSSFSTTDHFLDAHKQHPLCDDTVAIKQVQDAEPRLQSIKAEAGPSGQIIRDALVVHYFESAR
jgi:hypothetical protein